MRQMRVFLLCCVDEVVGWVRCVVVGSPVGSWEGQWEVSAVCG